MRPRRCSQVVAGMLVLIGLAGVGEGQTPQPIGKAGLPSPAADRGAGFRYGAHVQ